MSFKGKTVIVTGASSGIGAAIAISFAQEGADVAIVGRNEKKLAAVEQKSAANGRPVLVIKADVSNNDDAKRVIETTVEKFGKLDILVNNAGLDRPGSITDGKLLESYDEVFATNLRAPMQLTALAAPYLIKSKGNIVNISSVAGQIVLNPQAIAYCASKAALNNFTQGSALELSPHGVRVNAVSPGPVYTDILENSKSPYQWDLLKPFTALNRISDPEEIADLVLFLASNKARGITGSIYLSDNGTAIKRFYKV